MEIFQLFKDFDDLNKKLIKLLTHQEAFCSNYQKTNILCSKNFILIKYENLSLKLEAEADQFQMVII